VFEHDNTSPVDLVTARLDGIAERVSELAIARRLRGSLELPQKATPDAFRSRVARGRVDGTLAAALTDLAPGRSEPIARSPLNPPAPKGITLGERVVTCAAQIRDPAQALIASMQGSLHVAGNGLGFDARRLTPVTDPNGGNWIDPVVEVLAFHALTLVPVRGDGRRPSHRLRDTNGRLTWPYWHHPRTIAAIDLILDGAIAAAASGWYVAEDYRVLNAADPTRGYAARQKAR
jgi:hypothetical protein